ncbi:S9 family peptidase [Flavobacterium sp. LB2P53]|uniref:S9 family peptidase n=1 Tax=Flavobacterium sp. LB2P53 TaxID=2497481 RepID=UPI000F83268B|nr:prolyl oligopeptidase family serine peptidase [Flavobacterium sp. LB2P53]RTY67113.1 S9 family peptidase [Flavobacterium sp. LB2P53]
MMVTRIVQRKKKLRHSFFFRLVASCFLLVSFPSIGQVLQKKTVPEEDYHLWSDMLSHSISDKGGWASYSLQYDTADTLFAIATKSRKKYAFPHGTNGEFNDENWFACKQNDTLVLQDLTSGKVNYFPKISSYSFSGNGKYLILISDDQSGNQRLTVKNMLGQTVANADNVNEWIWNTRKDAIAYVTGKDKVEILEIFDNFIKKEIPVLTDGAIKNLSWLNQTIAFIQNNGLRGKLYAYRLDTGKLLSFVPESCSNFPNNMIIGAGFSSVTISNDGNRIFFKLKENVPNEDTAEVVQVWNGNDKQIYPNLKMYGDVTLQDKVAVWFVDSGRFLQISNREEPSALIGRTAEYALTWNEFESEPHFDGIGSRDIYVTAVQTGRKRLLLKGYPGTGMAPAFSPKGNYLSYSVNGDWWVYDFKKDEHRNITQDLGVPVRDIDYDRAGQVPLYGIAGWSIDDNSLFIYDQFDIWMISADGKTKKRLTKGRENKTTFRFATAQRRLLSKFDYMDRTTAIISNSTQWILSAQNATTGYSGFYRYDGTTGARPIFWEHKRTDRVVKAKNSNVFTFISQHFDAPPELLFVDALGKPKELYRSNLQHHNYLWAKVEKVSYVVDGKPLSGVLIYPAGFDPTVKYPMIVSIYERQGGSLHRYVKPTLLNENGINFTVLSSKGYFILLPDIVYEMRQTGESAKKCVLAAVDAVLLNFSIDPARIGLTGHSFGGFETDYIITKTNRFAAAVAGAAITDLVSSYLYYNSNYATSDFYRYEIDQERIGMSLFEDMSSYLNNSPVLLAQNVTTPLLAWTGDEDKQVHYFQSIEFYFALRRLKKEHTLLIYPEESHTIIDKEKQADLTKRIEAWFAKYLKS